MFTLPLDGKFDGLINKDKDEKTATIWMKKSSMHVQNPEKL